MEHQAGWAAALFLGHSLVFLKAGPGRNYSKLSRDQIGVLILPFPLCEMCLWTESIWFFLFCHGERLSVPFRQGFATRTRGTALVDAVTAGCPLLLTLPLAVVNPSPLLAHLPDWRQLL